MWHKLSALLLVLLVSACGSDSSSTDTPPSSQLPPDSEQPGDGARIIIPVVFHILYREGFPESNPPDSKIQSQITVLNEMFRGRNSDITDVPEVFVPLIADMQIEFSLASIDPNGNATTGITRTNSMPVPGETVAYGHVYYTNSGGKDAWPSDQYLNVWVNDMRDFFGGPLPFAGRAAFPGEEPSRDGILLATTALGTEQPLDERLLLGRTLAHEIGHWFGLYHLGGIEGGCEDDDGISDTPLSAHSYEMVFNPEHPSSSCGSVDMFMNIMALTHDSFLLMFSEGQKEAVWKVLAEHGERHSLLQRYQQQSESIGY